MTHALPETAKPLRTDGQIPELLAALAFKLTAKRAALLHPLRA